MTHVLVFLAGVPSGVIPEPRGQFEAVTIDLRPVKMLIAPRNCMVGGGAFFVLAFAFATFSFPFGTTAASRRFSAALSGARPRALLRRKILLLGLY